MELYLLEKSRTVTAIDSERNYHIFYYLYAGLTHEQQVELQLPEPSTHRFGYDRLRRRGSACLIRGLP